MNETLVLFTRWPMAGRTKTRLIPCLGSEGAAQLQREMTEHVLARVWPLVKRRGVNLRVCFDGGSKAQMRRWLGNQLCFVPQGTGDLGTRMLRASTEAFVAGAQSVIMIGADCPELDAQLITRAFDSLREHRVVFGPAKDGGYYLVGLNTALPGLFQDMSWGTGDVLRTSIARARQVGADPYLLPELSDIDEPADLTVWENMRSASGAVSVIIPTLNEAAHLPLTLKHVATSERAEIIVADGGSRDATVAVARDHGAVLVTSASGRGGQMNAGAAIARAETLLFLHADTLLPENWHAALRAALRQPNVVGGAFRFKIRDPFLGRGLVERTTNLRSRVCRLPYGDQALFVRRWAFDELSGFPNFPIMEDYEMVRRMRRLGRVSILAATALTSGRRWQELGVVRTTLINWLMILGFHGGVPPAKLAAWYHAWKPRPGSQARPG